MKATELTQPANESHSSGHTESDGSEKGGGANCQRNKRVSPQVGIEAKSQVTSASVCSSTTENHGNLVEVRRKRGRPRKKRPLLAEDKTHADSAVSDAIRHKEVNMTLPLPTSLENHVNNNEPVSVDGPLINDSTCHEISGPHSISDGNVVETVPVLPKRKRGRPSKAEIAAFKAMFAQSNAANVNKVSGAAWRLRSRAEQQPSTQEEKTQADRKGGSRQAEMTPIESSNTSRPRGAKRRGPKPARQQVPAKVSRLEISQEASSVLSTDPDIGERSEADKEVDPNTAKQETNTDGKGGQTPIQAEEEQHPEQTECTSPDHQLLSQPAAEPEFMPTEGLNRPDSGSPIHNDDLQLPDTNGSEEAQSKVDGVEPPEHENLPNSELPSTDVVTSSEQPPNSVEALPAVKTEDIEIELDCIKPVSRSGSPTPLQYNANTMVRRSGRTGQIIIFRRRKKGAKRRRRISTVLLPIQQRQEGSLDTQHITESGDVDDRGTSNDNINVTYAKRGGKTVLKCGYCGQTFKFLSQFIIHQRVHTGERPFKCSECGKGFSKNSNLNLHLKTHRKNVYQKCTVCNIKFSCSEYDSHMKVHTHVQQQEDNQSEKRNADSEHETDPALGRPASPEKKERKVCQYCSKTFRFPSALIRHVRVHTGEKPYKCDICGKAFGQAYFLRVHELTHWSVKRYNCTRCEKSFTHYSNAKNHTCRPVGSSDKFQPSRRVKPSLTYTCHICKNVFDSLQEFNSHMREHTGAKLYRCTYCDKLFGVLSEFTSHRSQCRRRTASGSKIKEENELSLIQYTVPALRCSSGPNSASSPLAAANCETSKKLSQTSRKKRFANSKKPFQSTVIPAHPLSHLVSKLNKLDTRSDPRKYLCPSCGRLFRHMGRLRAHMLTHAPGKSYTCACCGKTLENWKKLWHHQRIHRQRRGRFTCPQCGQGFRFVEPYKKHMSEHPDFQWIQVRPKKVFLPYQCEQCSCSFKTLDLLFSHQLCHSSTQDGLKDSDFDLSIDDHNTQSNNKISSPPTDSHELILHTDPEENNSTLNSLSQYPDPAHHESPLAPTVSLVQNHDLDLGKTSHHPRNTHSTQARETSHVRIDEHSLGKPITTLRTVKRHGNQNTSGSNEDEVKCAVCGNAYPTISDLYQHYLQHARGEV